MKVSEVAKAFGISVKELSSISGYSRQGLYDVIEYRANRNEERFSSFLNNLETTSRSMLNKDIAKANVQFFIRKKTIEELKKGKIGDEQQIKKEEPHV